jgi:arylsulfatase
MGRVAELAVGFPGYWGRPPRTNGYLSEILQAQGFATYAVGKWHLTPDDETHMGASRKTWPLARGFDRWYGFHGGETHQFVPALYHDNHSVPPPRSIEDGYHLSADLADRAIEFVGDLRAVEPSRPFFLYFCTGACHSPHQAPPAWISRYRGRFDDGWDAWRERTYVRQLSLGVLPVGTLLSPRPSWVPAWEDLGSDERDVSRRFMECFAAFLSYTDDQIGRLLGFLEKVGELDRTLVVLLSDNGASAEGGRDGSINDIRLSNLDPAGTAEMRDRLEEIGGPLTHNNYPWGWTMAGNTPFKRWKREVHEGGVADPCVVSWPSRLAAAGGSICHQFVHAIDVLPTVLELGGVEPPDVLDSVPQSPIDGISFAYLLSSPSAPERHETQYFEMFGSRAIYHRGWKAVTFHPIGPMYGDGLDPNASFDDDVWELYHVATDLSETHDLAASFPGRVAELVELWWAEAARNQVLPLDNRILWTLVHPRPSPLFDSTRFRYFPHGAQVPERMAANVRNRSHRLTVVATLVEGVVAEGVLLALGSALGGWSFHFAGGRLRYIHNLYGKARSVIVADGITEPGLHTLSFAFDKDDGAGGTGVLTCDGVLVGEGVIPRFTPSSFNGVGAGLTCGYEWGPAVGTDYVAPFVFNGSIDSAVIEVTGPVVRDPLAELEAILSQQ